MPSPTLTTTAHKANIVVYDPDLVSDPATNLFNIRAGLRFKTVDVSLFANNLFDSHPQLSLMHTNPGDPRFQAVTFRPRTIGITGVLRF